MSCLLFLLLFAIPGGWFLLFIYGAVFVLAGMFQIVLIIGVLIVLSVGWLIYSLLKK